MKFFPSPQSIPIEENQLQIPFFPAEIMICQLFSLQKHWKNPLFYQDKETPEKAFSEGKLIKARRLATE